MKPEPETESPPEPPPKPHFVLVVQDCVIGQETVIKPNSKENQNG